MLYLAIKRKVINKLTDKKMCQKTGPCITSWYRQRGKFSDYDLFFFGEHIFWTNILLNIKLTRSIFKNFCYNFSYLLCSGNIFFRFNDMFFSMKV